MEQYRTTPIWDMQLVLFGEGDMRATSASLWVQRVENGRAFAEKRVARVVENVSKWNDEWVITWDK